MSGAIRNIIFDFGGVLVELDKARCIADFVHLGFHQAASWIDAYSQQGIFKELELGLIEPEVFCKEVRLLAGVNVPDADIWTVWNRLITGIPTIRLEALIELRKHYRVFLLSNTNKIHWEYACQHYFPHAGYNVCDYFEQIFLSYELHEVKPGREIFHCVLNQTGIKVEETLFIDDSAQNCETAHGLGLHTYQPKMGEDWRKIFSNVLKL